MHAFERRTDRRTDKIIIARPRLHSVQRGINYVLSMLLVTENSTPSNARESLIIQSSYWNIQLLGPTL